MPHGFMSVVSQVTIRAAAVAGNAWPGFIAVNDEPMSATPIPSMVPVVPIAVTSPFQRRCHGHAVGVVPSVNWAIAQIEVATALYQTPSPSVAPVRLEYSPHASTM